MNTSANTFAKQGQELADATVVQARAIGKRGINAVNDAAKQALETASDASDALLAFLFEFQLRERFRYTNHWTEKDLLIWDNLGTIHRAIADYGPDEIRLIRRCQVMATKIFDPAFARLARAA